MTITSVPTRTIGSLGVEKVNRRAVSDPTKQTDADEWNLAADCIIHLVDTVGVESGYAATSLQGRVDALEGTSPTLAGDGYVRTWHFLQASEVVEWNNGGVDPPIHSSVPGGYCYHSLTGADPVCSTLGADVTHSQFTPHIKVRGVIHGDIFGAEQIEISCLDAATGNERFGVVLESGGVIRAMVATGGVPAYQLLAATWTTDKFLSLEFYEDGGKLVVVHDDVASAETTTATALPVPTGPFSIQVMSDNGSGAGSYWAMDYITLSDSRDLANAEIVFAILGV